MRRLRCLLACMALVVLLGGLLESPARAGVLAPPSHGHVSTVLGSPATAWLATPGPMALSLLKGQNSTPQAPTAGCGYNASTAQLLGRYNSHEWLSEVRALSGADPIILAGETYTITSRFTPKLFDGSAHARAYNYVLEQMQSLHYPASSIEQDPWTSGGISAMNLVLTIPGQITPTEVVALTAHLDSYSGVATSSALAPGADDNATGSAALLEAARLLRHYQFDRTLKLIWFTGEEQGLLGSASYVNDHSLGGYQGVVNLDMIGYDNDNDRCMELHVGTLPASDAVGQCYLESIQVYSLGLTSDYLTSAATSTSDHAPFWNQGVGAILVHQNGFTNQGGSCGGVRDHNPYYHTVNDTLLNSFPPYTAGQPNTVGADIARAGLAAVAGLAGNRGACFSQGPVVTVQYTDGVAHLSWTALPGAAGYHVYRRVGSGPEALKFSGSETEWTDTPLVVGWDHHYRVVAVAGDGVCQSIAGQTALLWVGHPQVYLPVVRR